MHNFPRKEGQNECMQVKHLPSTELMPNKGCFWKTKGYTVVKRFGVNPVGTNLYNLSKDMDN